MQAYNITETTGINHENKTFVQHVAEEVNDSMNDLGYSVDILSLVQAKPGSDPFKAGCTLTPDFSDTVEDLRENGMRWLSINEDLAGHFGKSRGSSNVTTIAVDEQLSAREVIEALAKCTYDDDRDVNQIQKAIHMMDLMREKTDPSPENIVAYDMFQKALGWYAERILVESGDFKKGTASQDKGGIDLWFNGNSIQLKTVVRYASKGPAKFRDKKHAHMFYQWNDDELVVGTLEEANDVNKAVENRPKGVTATNLKKSYNGGIMSDYHRSARVLWF